MGCSSDLKNQNEKDIQNSAESNFPEGFQELQPLTVLSDSVPSNTIRFKKVATFRDYDESHADTNYKYIGNMSKIAVDKSGRVFVAPTALKGTQTIYVFDSDGKYLKSVGRPGRGPGEFVRVTNIEVQSEKLYVYDEMLFRLTIFSLNNFEVLSQVSLSPELWRGNEELKNLQVGTSFYPIKNGSILLEFKEPSRLLSILNLQKKEKEKEKRYDRYFLLSEDGEISPKKIYEQEDLIFGASPVFPFEEGNLPHSRNPLMAVANDGKIYSACSDNFLIKVYNANGDYRKAIYYSYDNAKLDPNEIISNYEVSTNARNIAQNASYPQTWPALNKLLVDDEGRLWVSTINDSRDTFEWWVIDENGELFAKFDWPGQRLKRGQFHESILEVNNGYMYTYQLDDKEGYEGDIVKYQISVTKKQ